MPERRIRARRPVGWNTLLRKGHVHEYTRTADRRASRQSVEAALDEYEDELDEDEDWNDDQHD